MNDKKINMDKSKRIIAVLLSLYFMLLTIAPVSLRAEGAYNPLGGPSYPSFHDSYFTDDYGNILMYINVIGKVAKQGQLLIRENADFANVFALSGGVQDGANLRKILVIRDQPEESGKQVYVVDLKGFFKRGDCGNFIALMPGDTIIVPDKSISIKKIAQVISMTYPVISLYNILNNN